MNFQDWFDLYLSTYKRDIKPRTREEYVRQYRVYIAPIIGAQPLEAVTPGGLPSHHQRRSGQR